MQEEQGTRLRGRRLSSLLASEIKVAEGGTGNTVEKEAVLNLMASELKAAEREAGSTVEEAAALNYNCK